MVLLPFHCLVAMGALVAEHRSGVQGLGIDDLRLVQTFCIGGKRLRKWSD